jgi:hypothetical protein
VRTDTRRRLDELLLARAIEGLSDRETRTLEQLLAAHADVDAGAYDRAAAAVCLATFGGSGPMPTRLRSSLEKSAAALVMSSRHEGGQET